MSPGFAAAAHRRWTMNQLYATFNAVADLLDVERIGWTLPEAEDVMVMSADDWRDALARFVAAADRVVNL